MIGFFCILYNPGDNALTNIKSALAKGFKVFVHLNSVNEDYINKISALDTVILGDNRNIGLGPAFYQFETSRHINDISHFIYFDQDTVVEPSAWDEIYESYKSLGTLSEYGLFFYTNKPIQKKQHIVISSGCLFSVEHLKRIGTHDPYYFVEGVDYAYGLLLKNRGYKIKCITAKGIDHTTLQEGETIKCWIFNFNARHYPASRLKDFNRAHTHLIKDSAKSKEYLMLCIFVKSALMFNIRNLISKFLLQRR